MRRVLVIALVILAALVAAGPTAGAARPQRALLFELHSGGFVVQGRSALGSNGIRLLLYQQGKVAYYYVGARIGAGRVRARFGRLGSLDLRFKPDPGEGALGCGGGEGWQRGIFKGTIAFHGEHHYAHVVADRAPGWFETYPADGCSGGRRHRQATATASRAPHVAETGVELWGRSSPGLPTHLFYFYTENRPGGVRTVFNAFRDERREGMLIERGVQVYGGASAFDWNLVAGTARVEAPPPFTGRAFYRREPSGRARWWGSLRAPVLGAKPIRLTGAAFGAQLGSAG